MIDEANTRGLRIFESLYRLSAGGGVTTTTFTGSSTTLTSTTLPGALTCTVAFRVTSSETLGALKYEVDYSGAIGEFTDTGLNVDCISQVSGGSTSFFDDDAARILRQSTIAQNGFTGPTNLAQCIFSTEGGAPTADQLIITVDDASTPALQPANPTLAVSSINCSH